MIDPSDRQRAVAALLESTGTARRVLVLAPEFPELPDRLAGPERSVVALGPEQLDLNFERPSDRVGTAAFDAVIAGSVLETVYDLNGLLDDLRDVVAFGGRLILALPDGGAAGNGEEDRRLRFFSREAIDEQALLSGLTIERFDTMSSATEPDTVLHVVAAAFADDRTRAARLGSAYATLAARSRSAESFRRNAQTMGEQLRGRIDLLETELGEARSLSAREAAAARDARAQAAQREADAARADERASRLQRAAELLGRQLETATLERRAIDDHCFRLSQAVAESRQRALDAERALHRTLAPFANAFGSVAAIEQRLEHLRLLGAAAPFLFAQMNANRKR